MSAKNITELKAIKALLTPDEVRRAKELASERGLKLQAFYGMAIRTAIKEASDGNRQ